LALLSHDAGRRKVAEAAVGPLLTFGIAKLGKSDQSFVAEFHDKDL
jgi:hypothetical protein